MLTEPDYKGELVRQHDECAVRQYLIFLISVAVHTHLKVHTVCCMGIFCLHILHKVFSVFRGNKSVKLNHSMTAWRVSLYCLFPWVLLSGMKGAQAHSEHSCLLPYFYCLISEELNVLPVWRGESLRARRSLRPGRLTAQPGRKGGSDMILDGENQACAVTQQLLFTWVQLMLQSFLWGAAALFAIHAPAWPSSSIPSAAGRAVSCDGSVPKREGHVAVVTDEVRVVVPQRLVVLQTHPHRNMRGGMEHTWERHKGTDAWHTAWNMWCKQMNRLDQKGHYGFRKREERKFSLSAKFKKTNKQTKKNKCNDWIIKIKKLHT